MNITVIGLGYVGAVSAGCLARRGHHVTGVDVNPRKVASINAGEAPVARARPARGNRRRRRLRPAPRDDVDAAEAVRATDVSLICVRTPSGAHGSIDVTAMERVCEQIGPALARSGRRHTIVVRSTVLPGTTEERSSPHSSAARV